MRSANPALLALGLLLATPATAQDHAQHRMPEAQAPAQPQVEAKPAEAGTDESRRNGKRTDAADDATMNHAGMDHAGMDHAAMDHATMNHAPVDHATMNHAMPAPAAPAQAQAMDHAAMGHAPAAPAAPRTPVPEPTDADRAAAFAYADNHAAHDDTVQRYVLLDRLEGFDADEGNGLAWEALSWIGTDLDKLWLRSEGERVAGRTEGADLEVLYGRAFARWWDVVAGVRHDFRPGDPQDFLAVGVMGLAPYKFEIEATAYLGEGGRTAARFELEYETLLTNRLILQPLLELDLHGRDDRSRGIGSGLSTAEAGLRLRYEVRRAFAPYIGIVHERALGRTADIRRDQGEDTRDTRLVAGIRVWF